MARALPPKPARPLVYAALRRLHWWNEGHADAPYNACSLDYFAISTAAETFTDPAGATLTPNERYGRAWRTYRECDVRRWMEEAGYIRQVQESPHIISVFLTERGKK